MGAEQDIKVLAVHLTLLKVSGTGTPAVTLTSGSVNVANTNMVTASVDIHVFKAASAKDKGQKVDNQLTVGSANFGRCVDDVLVSGEPMVVDSRVDRTRGTGCAQDDLTAGVVAINGRHKLLPALEVSTLQQGVVRPGVVTGKGCKTCTSLVSQ